MVYDCAAYVYVSSEGGNQRRPQQSKQFSVDDGDHSQLQFAQRTKKIIKENRERRKEKAQMNK